MRRKDSATRTARICASAATLALSGALVACSGGSSDDATAPGGTATTPGNDIRTTEPEGSTGDTSDSTDDAGGSGGSGEYDDVNKVDLADHEFDLSWTEALKQARNKFDGDVSKIELEVENGRYSYKIELISDKQEFEYEIDANTGDVLDEDTDDLSADEVGTERKEKGFNPDKIIAVKDAMKTALGEQDGRVKEWKVEGKRGGPRFEFDIDKPDGSGDVEVKVDATSGELIGRS